MSVLEKIFSERRKDVAEAMSRVSENELRSMIRDMEPVRGFRRALEDAAEKPALIAEIKPASPSQGVINAALDVAHVAQAYERAGAHALSVLTEPRHFKGKLENIGTAKSACRLPTLRKDFIDDPYQVLEARAWGADAILLIVAALEPSQVTDLQAQALEMGMDVLVEVHDEAEAEIALAAGANLIGVNSRDLKTLATDLSVAERILPMVKRRALAVAESALSARQDVRRVTHAGADVVLIGTAFCASPDIEGKVREVMGW